MSRSSVVAKHLPALKAAYKKGTPFAISAALHPLVSDAYDSGVDAVDAGDATPDGTGKAAILAAVAGIAANIVSGLADGTASTPEEVADTESSYASTAGSLDVCAANDVGWVYVADDNPCPECEALDGTVNDPGDYENAPPTHESCLCTIEPNTDTADEGDSSRSRKITMTTTTKKPRARTQDPLLPYTQEVRFNGTAEVRESANGTGWTLETNWLPAGSVAQIRDGVGPKGYFRETATSTAFDSVDFSRTVLLYGHNRASLPLGCPADGTAKVWQDSAGWHASTTLDPSSPDHQSLRVALQRTRHGSSMCFSIGPNGDKWSLGADGVEDRVITRVDSVPEISITAFPAYGSTSTEMRSQAPDTRKRLRELHSTMQRELREGKTLSAATSQAITAALGHVTSAGDHLSGLLKPNGQGNPDDDATTDKGGNGVDGIPGGLGGDASGSRAALVFEMDRVRMLKMRSRTNAELQRREMLDDLRHIRTTTPRRTP